MTIPQQMHNVLRQVANEIILDQNNGQMRLSQVNLKSQCTWRWHILLCCGTIHEVPELCMHPFLVPLPLPIYRFWQVGQLIKIPSGLFSKFCFGGSLHVSVPGKASWNSKFWAWGFDFPRHQPKYFRVKWACLWCCFTTSMQVTAHIPCYVLFAFCILIFIYYHHY